MINKLKEPEKDLSEMEGWSFNTPSQAGSVLGATIAQTVLPLVRGQRGEKRSIGLWFNTPLKELDTTSNLDAQHPSTLYYLGRVKDIDSLQAVYVEKLPDGRIKHWAVLEERDYSAMEEIYDIEHDTIEKFPQANLNFRVTLHTDGGPSISSKGTKIFENS